VAKAGGEVRISPRGVRNKQTPPQTPGPPPPPGSYECESPGHLDPAATVDSSTRRALRSFQSSSSISISIIGSADHLTEHKNPL
jgi:hypothetical protein